MWLLYIAIPILIIAVVGSVAFGGVFTIIFVPLLIIAVVAAMATGALGRLISRPGDAFPAGGSSPPSGVDELVDARRTQQ